MLKICFHVRRTIISVLIRIFVVPGVTLMNIASGNFTQLKKRAITTTIRGVDMRGGGAGSMLVVA